MTIGLEKLVQDIKNEKSIWPVEKVKSTPAVDEAWERVGVKNKMSGNHVKSIFKVLSKKYESEKLKPKTSWKLFEYLKFLDETNEPEPEPEIEDEIEEDDGIPDDADLEDDGEFVELLEVNEFEEESGDEEQNESGENSSHNVSMEVEENDEQIPNPTTNELIQQKKHDNALQQNQEEKTQALSNVKPKSSPQPPPASSVLTQKRMELKKVVQQQSRPGIAKISEEKRLAALMSPPVTSALTMNRSINLKKAMSPISVANGSGNMKTTITTTVSDVARNQINMLQQHLSENLKRKLPPIEIVQKNDSDNNIDLPSPPPPAKRQLKEYVTQSGLKFERITMQKALQPKQQQQNKDDKLFNENTEMKSLDVKTTVSTMLSPQQQNAKISPKQSIMNKTPDITTTNQQNGILEINEKRYNTNQQNNAESIETGSDHKAESIGTVLPEFFRDLYNSKKYDCFGMYVASAMNRLPSNLAVKLESKILQAILDVNSSI